MSNWISEHKCWYCESELASDGELKWCMDDKCIVHGLCYTVDGDMTTEVRE